MPASIVSLPSFPAASSDVGFDEGEALAPTSPGPEPEVASELLGAITSRVESIQHELALTEAAFQEVGRTKALAAEQSCTTGYRTAEKAEASLAEQTGLGLTSGVCTGGVGVVVGSIFGLPALAAHPIETVASTAKAWSNAAQEFITASLPRQVQMAATGLTELVPSALGMRGSTKPNVPALPLYREVVGEYIARDDFLALASNPVRLSHTKFGATASSIPLPASMSKSALSAAVRPALESWGMQNPLPMTWTGLREAAPEQAALAFADEATVPKVTVEPTDPDPATLAFRAGADDFERRYVKLVFDGDIGPKQIARDRGMSPKRGEELLGLATRLRVEYLQMRQMELDRQRLVEAPPAPPEELTQLGPEDVPPTAKVVTKLKPFSEVMEEAPLMTGQARAEFITQLRTELGIQDSIDSPPPNLGKTPVEEPIATAEQAAVATEAGKTQGRKSLLLRFFDPDLVLTPSERLQAAEPYLATVPSERNQTILRRMLEGELTDTIAQDLGLSLDAVQAMAQRAYRKFAAASTPAEQPARAYARLDTALPIFLKRGSVQEQQQKHSFIAATLNEPGFYNPRQETIVKGLFEGDTHKGIASDLGRTVKLVRKFEIDLVDWLGKVYAGTDVSAGPKCGEPITLSESTAAFSQAIKSLSPTQLNDLTPRLTELEQTFLTHALSQKNRVGIVAAMERESLRIDGMMHQIMRKLRDVLPEVPSEKP